MTYRMLKTLALGARLALLACLVGLATPPAQAQARFEFDKTPGNLPKSVLPSRYVLTLALDPARDDFSGTVAIDITVRQPVGAVVLHARDLEASTLELRQGRTVRPLQLTPGPIEQSWWLEPADAEAIAPGRYTLHIAYRGKVNHSGVGLFHADHTVAGKLERTLATQLEATDARNVFPSFDEPSFRAAFDITVRAPRGYQVLSNMPEAAPTGVEADGDALLHHFKPTPPMPSYLVSVSVGRFDVLSGRVAGVPLRVLTAPGKRAQAAYAMAVTKQVVPFYNAYFGVPFALPKLDQQAVPSVRGGAMEDWGLISYSESDLLFDPAKSSPRTQRGVFNTVAHEISHQWFGNLVTAASWEEIWLNEAFATWMASKATERFNPAWQSRLEEREDVDEAMAGDTGNATRAIRSGPVSEAAVFDVFDSITYTKGGAVLSMLEQWLGEATFRRGLAGYMRERQFSNATAGDLWFHMAQASQRDVAAVAASWTDQPGFPLVQVASDCVAGAASTGQRAAVGDAETRVTRVTLTQRRLRDGTPTPVDANVSDAAALTGVADAAPPLWQIPVRLARAGKVSTVLLTEAQQSFDLPGCSTAPLLANAGGVGFYRVAYDNAQHDALAAQFTRLPPADQVMLLSDSFALAQAGVAPLARWLSLLQQLPRVEGPARAALFELAGNGFEFLDAAMADTPTRPLLRTAGVRLFAPELARLGWAERRGDDAQTLKLRGSLIGLLARLEDAPTLARAQRLFDDAEADGADVAKRAPLAASIRSQVLRAAGIGADRPRFDRLLARFKAAGGEQDRWAYARALASGRDAQRAQELMAMSLAGGLPTNLAIALPRLVSENSPFGAQAYAFTLEHWDALAQLAGNEMFARYNLLPGAAKPFNDAARAAQLVDDQRARAGADGAAPAARMAARIGLLAAVREREAEPLERLLR